MKNDENSYLSLLGELSHDFKYIYGLNLVTINVCIASTIRGTENSPGQSPLTCTVAAVTRLCHPYCSERRHVTALPGWWQSCCERVRGTRRTARTTFAERAVRDVRDEVRDGRATRPVPARAWRSSGGTCEPHTGSVRRSVCHRPSGL